MKITDEFMEARYGDADISYLDPRHVERCEARHRDIWRAIRLITGTQIEAPSTRYVHSPRALPALIGVGTDAPALVWDAGLGTLFDQLSFPMPYGQPAQVVEAILRQMVGVRCVLAARPEQGAAQGSRAQSLLELTSVDLGYQEIVDAEMQFEVFLLTEMQERFALAHELAHYLSAYDRPAFSLLSTVAFDCLDREHWIPSSGALREEAFHPSARGRRELFDLDLDPYAWYLKDRNPDSAADWPSLLEEVETVRALLATMSERETEEVLCDLMGGLAVCLAAHMRQAGWTAHMGASCSRLALSNLEAILSIDEWVQNEGGSPVSASAARSDRALCLNILLPLMLPSILELSGRPSTLTLENLHSVMHLVEDRFAQSIGAAWSELDWASEEQSPDNPDQNAILLTSGFVPIRPEVDHRLVQRAASGQRFEFGVVRASLGVNRKLAEDPGRESEISNYLRRHTRGDWGEIPREDSGKNEDGLFEEFEPPTAERVAHRGALWSAYELGGEMLLVITSRDRTVTDLLLMSEY